MNKYFFVVVFILIFLFFVIYKYNFNSVENIVEKICFEEKCFDLEIADSEEERFQGLMFREELCENCSMLFIFEKEGNYKFWMKNTKIPLDIIWINKNFEVIYIAETDPCVEEICKLYGPEENSLYILEINKGESKDIGLGVGRKIDLVYK
jgi:uncharacterized membrane protein (UPF0127 family)